MRVSGKYFSVDAWTLLVLLFAVVLAPVQGKISSVFMDCQACSVDFETEKSENENHSDSNDHHVAFLGHAVFLPLLLESSGNFPTDDGEPLSTAPSRLYRPPRA